MQVSSGIYYFAFSASDSGCGGPHATAVKIGLSVFIVFGISFSCVIITKLTNSQLPGQVYYIIYFNNVANFFVYLIVDAQFRNALKKLFKK